MVIPGIAYHVIQRGNRRQRVFFREEDKAAYLSILKAQATQFRLSIWAYCLMDNHVHLIVVPWEGNSLARGIGETHRLYTRRIHFQKKWRGYLWQGRFNSCPMDEKYLYAAVRYVERNPVRAGIVKKAESYKWSSAKVHCDGKTDGILERFYLMDEIQDWGEYLNGQQEGKDKLRLISRHVRTGRPLGNDDFIEKLERISGRILRKKKPGPKRDN